MIRASQNEMASEKLLAGGVVSILLLAVCVTGGAVASPVLESNKAEKSASWRTTEIIKQLCQPADHREACISTLNNANSSDPKQLLKSAVLAAADALEIAFHFSDNLIVEAEKEARAEMAIVDCMDLFGSAARELQGALSLIGDNDLHTLMHDSVDDLETWLSSVVSYQQTCIDGFLENSTIKPIVEQGIIHASHLIDNVLAILSGLPEVLQLNLPVKSRRLLSLGKDGYPTWLSASDRNLLATLNHGGLMPNAIVAQDGSGDFNSITAAINSYPKNFEGRYVIYVKAGIYQEYATVTMDKRNVFIYGDGSDKTIVTGNKSVARSGLRTWQTATFAVDGGGFIAKFMAFENTAGPYGEQAVAIRVNSDMSVFYNCRFDGYQDTLYYQAKRQFYRSCVVSGTVDFIFGFGVAMFQDCTIIVKMPKPKQMNTVIADGKSERHLKTGSVIHNCTIVADANLARNKTKIASYLGRPWRKYAITVVMESEIEDFIWPEGWIPFQGKDYLDTLYYGEYANTGPGANTSSRVHWKTFHVLNKDQALQFTTGSFLKDNAVWIKNAATPVLIGLKG